MRLVDSHCHLHLMDLTPFAGKVEAVIEAAISQGVEHLLCVAVDLTQHDYLVQLASHYPNISLSVGVHPNHDMETEPSVELLVELSQASHCVAMGETGLDYYRVTHPKTIQLQQQRFIHHIRAARLSKRPLIIHTRQAAEDTLFLLREENAIDSGGVFHCFTETLAVAKAALELGFYISFSGIVTFKNAIELQEVAKYVPLDRMLIETDSPYLAPTPFRGQQNQPAFVHRVAEVIADLKGLSLEAIAEATTCNFYTCFPLASPG